MGGHGPLAPSLGTPLCGTKWLVTIIYNSYSSRNLYFYWPADYGTWRPIILSSALGIMLKFALEFTPPAIVQGPATVATGVSCMGAMSLDRQHKITLITNKSQFQQLAQAEVEIHNDIVP